MLYEKELANTAEDSGVDDDSSEMSDITFGLGTSPEDKLGYTFKDLKTFIEALDAFRTAMPFRFFGWLTENMNVSPSYRAGLGYIWAEKFCHTNLINICYKKVILIRYA